MTQVITLTTDFGTADSYVGAMKGVLLSIAPWVQIVDICHHVPPQDILAGAMILEETCAYYPTGTIHVAVVDPGVGSSRPAVAIKTNRYTFVGPDNGLFDLALRRERIVSRVKLNNSRFQLDHVSATFHGRDIFAPAAAYIAGGHPLASLGESVEKLNRLDLSEPVESKDSLEVHVLRADRFGNMITDLRVEQWRLWNPENLLVNVEIGGNSIGGIQRTYSDVPTGDPVAYFGSSGRLEVGVNGGSAAAVFDIARGAAISIKMA